MPYQAEKDATIPRVIAEGKNDAGEVTATYESVTHAAGAVIYENDIAPHILRRLEEGDDHLSTLLRYIDDNEAREILGQQSAAVGAGVAEEELLHEEERLGTDSPTIEPGLQNDPSAVEEVAEAAAEAAVEASTEEEEVAEEVETEAVETEVPDEGVEEETTTEEAESEIESVEETGTEETEVEEAEETEGDGSGGADEESADETEEVEETIDAEDASDLDGMSKQELNRVARSLNIPGRSKMKEEGLRQAIVTAREAAASEAETE